MNDIEVLEEYIKKLKLTPDGLLKNNEILKFIEYKEIQAIENLLKERQSDKERIKELEEKLKGKTDNTNKLIEVTNLYLNSIPTSLIKEKIEELVKKIEDDERHDEWGYISCQIQVLEELLNKNVK